MANMVQLLHVKVTNTSDKRYLDSWEIYDNSTGNYIDCETEERPSFNAGETREFLYYFKIKEPGNYTLLLGHLGYPKSITITTFSLIIKEYKEPSMKSSLQIDMLEKTEEGNYLYSDFQNPTSVSYISGIATVTNEEDYPIFPDWVLLTGNDGLPPLSIPGIYVNHSFSGQLQGLPSNNNLSNYSPWNDGIGSKETIIIPFSYKFKGKYEGDGDELICLYAFYQKLQEIHFTPKQCTNTYWTADQHVKPLPQEGMELKVPKEAVAVDFRGNYGVDDVFTVDVTEANPNCLYYLNNLDYVPKGLDYDRLVIRDYAIRDLVIDERHDFYCPMPFEAKTALLTVTPEGKEAFEMNSGAASSCSGTITLPFDAQRVQLTDVNGDSTFGQDGLTFFRFAGIRPDLTQLFSPVLDLQLLAYEPYLFNSRPSRIAFSAENITVPATRPAVTHTQYFDFKGTTTAKTGDMCLLWSQEDGCFALDANEYKNTELRPFTAAIYAEELLGELLYEFQSGNNTPVTNPDASSFIFKFPIAFLDAEENKNTTSIHQLQTSTPQPPTTLGVYSLTGQYLGRSGEVSLKPGLYVIDGKKRFVR